MSKILYISSEAFPLIKTGGLGDVAGSLPNALLKNGQDVRLLLPAYREVLKKIGKFKVRGEARYYKHEVRILETRLPGSNVTTWLVDCPPLFDRSGGPYSDEEGLPWSDNALRFALFCRAAVELAMNRSCVQWQPDIVHCNDWQSGLVPALLSLESERPATVFTIHNLAYQGLFDEQTFTALALPPDLWQMNGLEFYGQLSFIKGGLAYADRITTVSPTYAQEILQPEYGYGLDALLSYRQDVLSGIINGLDEKHWNPGTDKHLVQTYNRRSLAKKIDNKLALQTELALPVDASVPLIGMVGRLVEQKGLELILQGLSTLLAMPLQMVILGTGERHYEQKLAEASSLHPQQIKLIIGYDEALAHRIEAASDIYLMPSIFEPCGLNQLYSLTYGTLPIVTPVGGLADTVVDASDENIEAKIANGFVMQNKTVTALTTAVEHALLLYQKPEVWKKLQLTAMSGDYTWQASAENYIALYQDALNKH